MACVYLLHFDRPYFSPTGARRPQHYLGATSLPLDERMARHHSGDGAALIRAALKVGIKIEVVRVWEVKNRREAFKLEIVLKRRRLHRLLCPRCNGDRKVLINGVQVEQ